MKRNNIILLCIFVISSYFLLKPIMPRKVKIKAEKEKIRILNQKIEEQKKIKEKLEKEIEETVKDENVEKFARERLNMSNQGERVYKFVDGESGDKK